MDDPSNRAFLRHTLATVAYRGGKAIRDATADFATLKIHDTTRTPVEILAHAGDLFDWALSQASGKETWNESSSADWNEQVDRFFASLHKLDEYLASDAPLNASAESLFQGAIADALTHIGQLAMLRRIGGAPVRGENYSRADIRAGRVGREQSPAKREFD